jgi:transcriptional regulator with XRE-family HTH domain
LRRAKKLTLDDIARVCDVDKSLVVAWEASSASQRAYPSFDHIMDLYLKLGMDLLELIDLDAIHAHGGQIELPGLSDTDDEDLGHSLEALQEAIEDLMPDEQERELLRRFRNADPERQRFILQLIGH